MTRASGFWNSFSKQCLELLYPTRCALCTDWSDSAICATCQAELHPSGEGLVQLYDGDSLDFKAAAFDYQGRAAQAVRRLKYSRVTSLGSLMAAEVAKTAATAGLLGYDLFVPIPIHWTRRSSRGFNQAEILCAALPPERISPEALLMRTRATRPQVGMSREQRLQNLTGAFAASTFIKGKRVVLVDDVVTTLQTARECAKALKAAGAKEVGVLAFAGEAPLEPR